MQRRIRGVSFSATCRYRCQILDVAVDFYSVTAMTLTCHEQSQSASVLMIRTAPWILLLAFAGCASARPTPAGPLVGEPGPYVELSTPYLDPVAQNVLVLRSPTDSDAQIALEASVVAEPAEPPTRVVAVRYIAPILRDPAPQSPWIGYLREGGLAAIDEETIEGAGCPVRGAHTDQGWHAVEGGGYVCVGRSALFEDEVSRTELLGLARPPTDTPMPYQYESVRSETALLRTLPARGTSHIITSDSDGTTNSPDESITLEGVRSPRILRRLTRGMYVSIDRVFHTRFDTRYLRTQSGGYLREGTSATVQPPLAHGVELSESMNLPMAFVITSNAHFWQRSEPRFSAVETVPMFSMYSLVSVEPVVTRNEQYYETTQGNFLRGRTVRVVTVQAPPADLAPDERWVDVNLTRQFVVAYEGAKPVYATLTSTGAPTGGANYETVQGEFRIESKHITATMDGAGANGGRYSIEDVPWVMYFHGSFALHGAFWHNGFGRVRSHGCVNLPPTDARWIFHWSAPELPQGWHAVVSSGERLGTRVFVHYDGQELGTRGGPRHIPRH
jgi:hypothetical protein